MAVKLRDIAERAGVSVTTVSHVINGYKGSGIKRETWDKVLTISRELGYRPNAIARSLKFQRTNTIGYYNGHGYRDARDQFMGEIYTGIQHGCDEFKLDFLIRGQIDQSNPYEVETALGDGKVDGLIVHAPATDPVVLGLLERRMPAVAIADRQPHLPSLLADNNEGMNTLVDYLWSRGHRSMAYLTAQVSLEAIHAREQAFIRRVSELGGRYSIRPFPWGETQQFLEHLMTEPNRPTAVCSWHDNSAYFLVDACLTYGIRVPDDLAVVGFDGLLEKRLPARRLVTVAVPWEQMAIEAVHMLVRWPEGKDKLPPVTLFPTTFVPGDTA